MHLGPLPASIHLTIFVGNRHTMLSGDEAQIFDGGTHHRHYNAPASDDSTAFYFYLRVSSGRKGQKSRKLCPKVGILLFKSRREVGKFQ